jgi:ABC-type phosphate/phosphonate transport system ATPase subunit
MTAQFCTRVIAIRNGTVIYDGDPHLSPAQLAQIYSQDGGSELEEGFEEASRPLVPALATR